VSEHQQHRRPAAFSLDDDRVIVSPTEEKGGLVGPATWAEPDSAALPAPLEDLPRLSRKRFRWGMVFWCAAGGLALLAAALATLDLVQNLFARNVALGGFGLMLAILAAVSLGVIAAREIAGLLRLAAVEHLHQRAADAIMNDDRTAGRVLVRDLIALSRSMPRLARARTRLQGHLGDIIDGGDMIRLAERELMAPLDQDARKLVSASVVRVSVVTAVSSRAGIDMLFVFGNAIVLIRRLAFLYGARPGTLGLLRLLRHVVTHLALTGGVATSDGLIQQLLGHGIAAKLSARLGEGMLNGLLTARLGLAAIDVIRPLPFAALSRPTLGDLMGEVLRGRDDDAPHPHALDAEISAKVIER
jgi:putative membrane protein